MKNGQRPNETSHDPAALTPASLTGTAVRPEVSESAAVAMLKVW